MDYAEEIYYETVPDVSGQSMTLGEIIQEEKRKKRLIPTESQLQERVVGGHEDASAMFRTNPADPGELVRLNCSTHDITPILIDVAPVTDKAFLDVRGWTLFGPFTPIPVRCNKN